MDASLLIILVGVICIGISAFRAIAAVDLYRLGWALVLLGALVLR